MPIVQYIPKETVEIQHELILKLQKESESCQLLRGKSLKETYLFSIWSQTDKPPYVAVNRYQDGIYAIETPGYLNKGQLGIFDQFLQEIEIGDKLIVFSLRNYEAVQAHSYGRPISVILYA